MKKMTIELTEEEYNELRRLVWYVGSDEKYHRLKPRRIVEQFVSDLTKSERSCGSDERYLADEWYMRSVYNF